MRLIPAFTLVALLMSSCATTMTGDNVTENKIPKRDIQSVTFINGSPPVSAKMRRDKSLKVDSDLNTKMEIKDGYNTVLSEKAGMITRDQFEAITEKLNASNYIYLKPAKPSGQSALGSGKQILIVNSDLGAHRFVNGGGVGFPEPISEVFAMKDQLSPK
ncbi:MAG: hypothetical protein ACPGSM_05725 [Thiolinea sp.]